MFFILLYFVYAFFLWSTYSFYDNLCVNDTFFAIAKVASNVICWWSNGYFVAIVPHKPMPKGQNFPHTISISAMATPVQIHCSNCLSKGFAASACGCPVTTTQIIAQLLRKSTLDLKREWRLTKAGAIVFPLSSPVDLKESWKLYLRSFV